MLSRLREAFRRSRALRAAIGATVLALAFAVQYRLANIPLPVDIDATGKFSPAAVNPNQKELVIVAQPFKDSDEPVLLLHDGHANEVVDVHFDSAQFDEEVTVGDLAELGFTPPATPGKIDYTSPQDERTAAAGLPCRTSVTIEAKDGQRPPALRLFQRESGGAGRHRLLEFKTDGAELVVRVGTSTPPEATAETRGCRKLLRAGSLSPLPLPPSIQVSVVAARDSSFRIYFKPLDAKAPLWEGGAGGFYEPFALGAKPPLKAREVSVRRLQEGDANPVPDLSARAVEGGPPLNVYGLKIGSDELQLKVSGRGEVSVNGEVMTVDLVERAKKYELIAIALAVLNGALLTWFVRLVTRKDAPPAAE